MNQPYRRLFYPEDSCEHGLYSVLVLNEDKEIGGAGERALTELLREGREFIDVLAGVLAAGDTETKLKVEALQ